MAGWIVPAVKVAAQIVAGIGVGTILDKLVRPQAPVNIYPEPINMPRFNSPRALWLIVAFIIGAFAVRIVGNMFNIKILKK